MLWGGGGLGREGERERERGRGKEGAPASSRRLNSTATSAPEFDGDALDAG